MIVSNAFFTLVSLRSTTSSPYIAKRMIQAISSSFADVVDQCRLGTASPSAPMCSAI